MTQIGYEIKHMNLSVLKSHELNVTPYWPKRLPSYNMDKNKCIGIHSFSNWDSFPFLRDRKTK